ncbi:MerR family transcriptional regulator [Auraticoccus monumenti]|uniref:DNA-binding transcriptional regulator, MerR family n=1 Tax=Auraticoccus monumenti TaxID=675864 RepID=A0A1G7BRG7_9ACTN|nr:MerR family transcriptional regulator [Auraticoccus monumenti]SDE29593.1 DNA-binding transcriptional regulator, MerR family [Auraticoccus monumenti]
MSWSTRELAVLAGTTVNTVRHYHRRGLLPQPDRSTNGYKRYGVDHLVRLLQIRRLRDVGVPIAEMEQRDTGVGTSARVLEQIDAELVATIERSRRVRSEIEEMLHHPSTGEVPPGFEELAERLSPRERSLTLIYAQLYDDDAMADVRRMLEAEVDDSTAEFERLPADADEVTRLRLAHELAGPIARALDDYPWITAPQPHLLKDERTTASTWVESVSALYNRAQLDVLERASRLARELEREDEIGGEDAAGEHRGAPVVEAVPEATPIRRRVTQDATGGPGAGRRLLTGSTP